MNSRYLRSMAGVLVALMLVPLAGCGGGQRIDAQNPYQQPMPQQQPRQGSNMKKGVVVLAAAAALYYLYKRSQNRQGEGPNGRYYLSKNGRVYYRDLKTGQYQWVDPPQQPISVPMDEYQRVTGQQLNNYNGQVIQQGPQGWPGNQAYR